MGQLSIDTLNKTDRDNAMVALHAIAINNGEDLLFCPINDFNDKVRKLEVLNSDYLKCQDDNNSLKEELKNEMNRNNQLYEANVTLNKKLTNCEQENEVLEAEIKDLKEKLSAYIPGFGGDGKILYYKPDGEKLETTIHDSALYVGTSVGENVFEFQFNEEKGPHQKAIQNKTELLLPFCDIEYEALEANYIEHKDKGTFSLFNGEFKIINKAKISILKK